MGTVLAGLMGMLGLLTIVILVRLSPPPMESIRILEQRKKPRGERGRVLLEKMGALSNPVGASLRGQDLRDVDLQDAFLSGIDLSDADLRDVDLAGADLEGAILTDADVRGANLETANLSHARLLRVRYDAHTRWPSDFDPVKAGAVRVE